MNRILIILLLTIPFIGFGQTESIRTYHENGQIKNEGVLFLGKKIGLWKKYYKNGNLKEEHNWDKKMSLKKYHENGNLKFMFLLVDGNTVERYFYEDGKSISREDKRIPNKNSFSEILKFDYYETSFFKNGNIEMEGNKKYSNKEFEWFEKDGLWIEYYINGKTKSRTFWSYGSFISKRCWDKNGKEIECKEL